MRIQKAIPIIAGCLIALGVQTSRAVPTTVDMSDYGIGYITPTVIPPSGLDVSYLNNMINVYNGTAVSPISGETYTVEQGSLTPNAPLSSASSLNSEVSVSGSPTGFNISLGSGFTYLVAQWDGPNGADAVYYIGGLSSITLQNLTDFVNASGGAYGLSGYWLAGPNGGGTPGVPDGGTTIMMLGSALTGLAFISRKFRKS